MSNEEKDLDAILAKLSPKVRNLVQKAEEVVLEKQETPSLLLNQGLEGGIGYGRQTLIWGNKSSGKSSFCLEMIGRAQKQGKTAAWVDAEESYDPAWAKRLGVDPSKLIHSPVKTIADIVEVVTALMAAGIDIVVVDSISTPLPDSYFEKNEKKGEREVSNLKDTKQIGGEARDWANAVRMMNYANKGTALILISQLRNKISTYGASKAPTGGEAMLFYSSTVIKLWSSPREADQLTQEFKYGNVLIKRPVGREVNWEIMYNKTGQPSLSGKYDFYYKGENVGIDYVGEIVTEAVDMGLIKKSQSWYSYNGSGSMQGKQAVVDWLKGDELALAEVVEKINESKS